MSAIFLLFLENSIRVSMIFICLYIVFDIKENNYKCKYKYYASILLILSMIIPFKLGKSIFKIKLIDNRDILITGFSHNQIINTRDSVIHINILNLIAIIWVMGITMYLVKYFVNYYKLRKLVNRWSKNIKHSEAFEILKSEKDKLGINQNINLCVSRFIDSPISQGLLKPYIAIPDCSYSDYELSLIFRHELIHIKRKDMFFSFLLVFASAINWFNPMIYFISKYYFSMCEGACDYEVIGKETLYNQKLYVNILSRPVSQLSINTGFANNFFSMESINSKRILSIINIKKQKNSFRVLSITLILIILTGSLVSIPKNQKVTINSSIEVETEDGAEMTLKLLQE